VIRLFVIRVLQKGAAMNMSLVTKVRSVVAGHFGIAADRLADDARLHDDLGADWLDRLELLIVIEDQVPEIEINDELIEQIETVGDLMRVVEDATLGRPRGHPNESRASQQG
jgi:acyl carrier protein